MPHIDGVDSKPSHSKRHEDDEKLVYSPSQTGEDSVYDYEFEDVV